MSCISADNRSAPVKKPAPSFDEIGVAAPPELAAEPSSEQTPRAIPPTELRDPMSNFIGTSVYRKEIDSPSEGGKFGDNAPFFNSNGPTVRQLLSDTFACNYCLGDPSSRKFGQCRQPYRRMISPEDDKIEDVEERELKQHYLILGGQNVGRAHAPITLDDDSERASEPPTPTPSSPSMTRYSLRPKTSTPSAADDESWRNTFVRGGIILNEDGTPNLRVSKHPAHGLVAEGPSVSAKRRRVTVKDLKGKGPHRDTEKGSGGKAYSGCGQPVLPDDGAADLSAFRTPLGEVIGVSDDGAEA
ncbi:hypothetical protein SLS61_001831 [Didymella pomorum]